MTILHAFFVLMYCTGIIAAVYFIGEFLGLHVRHRRIARNRRRRLPPPKPDSRRWIETFYESER